MKKKPINNEHYSSIYNYNIDKVENYDHIKMNLLHETCIKVPKG